MADSTPAKEPPVVSAEEALRMILARTPVLGKETVALEQAVDRVLACDIRSRSANPPFDNSAMDGYAVRALDLARASPSSPVELRLRDAIRAGSGPGRRLGAGEAARIMTGAPLPPGADSVVMQERVLALNGSGARFEAATRLGSHVRRRGEDLKAGRLLLKAGTRLRPYEIALLAAQGITKVLVIRRPLVAVLATGDELRPPRTRTLAPGLIRDSNGPALRAALSRWGLPVLDLGIVKDEPVLLRAALARALRRADLVLIAGGVSAGDYDHTKAVLARLGVRTVFWKAAIKPGKPLFFGLRKTGARARAVFGLPGNPVAAMVCVEEFVRPALEKLQGHAPKHASYHLRGRARNEYPTPADRRQYLFCRAESGPDGYELDILRPQGSALLGMAAGANALAAAPTGRPRVRRGDALPFRWLK